MGFIFVGGEVKKRKWITVVAEMCGKVVEEELCKDGFEARETARRLKESYPNCEIHFFESVEVDV